MTTQSRAPSSSEEGVGGGGDTHEILLERAARMRTNPTEPEKRLWMELRGSRLGGHKVRRQAVIGNRIVDFYCPAKALVIEIDGDTHDPEQDRSRDIALRRDFGFQAIRFTNEEVMRNMEGVLARLGQVLDELPDRWGAALLHHPPAPFSEEEGE